MFGVGANKSKLVSSPALHSEILWKNFHVSVEHMVLHFKLFFLIVHHKPVKKKTKCVKKQMFILQIITVLILESLPSGT